MPFNPYHLPALFIATTQTLGGIWPIFFNTSSAMLEFGLPPRVANSREGQTAFVVGSARTTVIGLVMWMLYLQGKYAELDGVMVVLGLVLGAVDCWVCVREGVGRWGVFRGVSGILVAGWGVGGFTER
ncbi:hypothetical protein QBC34DRAFT_294123 [Podospora aff. communis PSN243]|uniref:Major facilitator superfamily (MFS) profile domain-containing protein n=1 Tax=Podospora aff. communis PSN243 TaxID=3040156 RepID=A0AAV9GVY0_9PEZI|nr:hypothetical protein QBC34DRAFT_294123 [Podospora aff. communis PSN243]